ncbi:tripeptidyl peptidase A [Lentinula edodes]|uniref:tripeptidyl peptidase A n=1 Tax=Lentinula edodes TaxID=5353 RepID=UPI001E8E3F21|nr:tripeptidyl peptidase A [Lentinula edodes]KAH7876381.1 tripeptidyl peptidase A [Lentinula edodes]KAJ3903499.1 tripeptidyl peptidase A [Lentinula edodes]
MKLFWIWLTFSTGLSLAVNPQRLTSGRLKQSVVPPQQWRKYSAPLPGSRIELRIGLVQPFMHVLENHIQEISDPDHERYGQHLSKSEVETLISPQEQSIQLVTEWLHVHGIEDTNISCTPAQDWIVVTLPISLAEKMLDTNYYVWQHDDGDFTIRTTSYNLPEHLFNHIDLIQPTTMFARLSNMKTTLYMTKNNIALGSSHAKELTLITPSSDSQNDCNYTVTLNCLQSLYNTVGYQTRAHSRNSIGLTGYLEQYANQEDLKLFFADQNPGAANASLDVILINGGFNNQSAQEAGDEANLDVQFALGLSYPTPGVFYSTGGEPPFDPDQGTESNTNEPYAKWLDYIFSQDNPPLTISTSYGDHEQTVPEDYARRTCERFMALGARGVTLTFSSGDGGVGDGISDPAFQTCLTNDGKNETRFLPVFPSSCPYVTSVGGTRGIPEEAAFFSGGGFSFYFDRPWYQDRAVNEFLETLGEHTYSDLFNRYSSSAYPDVSAQGVNFRVFIGSKPYLISGTSASSPTFAGIVALLNDARLHAGLPPLGFLNPLLYKRGAEALNDVTVGNNPGCGTNGFNATEGWDPVSGLGTPNFEKLEKIVLESQMWKRSG